jgi:hypothetical protein
MVTPLYALFERKDAKDAEDRKVKSKRQHSRNKKRDDSSQETADRSLKRNRTSESRLAHLMLLG